MSVELVHQNPNIIHVWGWNDEDWLDKDRPHDTPTTTVKKTISLPPPTKKKVVISPEDVSIMGQKRHLSARLRKALNKHR